MGGQAGHVNWVVIDRTNSALHRRTLPMNLSHIIGEFILCEKKTLGHLLHLLDVTSERKRTNQGGLNVVHVAVSGSTRSTGAFSARSSKSSCSGGTASGQRPSTSLQRSAKWSKSLSLSQSNGKNTEVSKGKTIERGLESRQGGEGGERKHGTFSQ